MRYALALVLLASCDRFLHRSVPDAGVVTTPTTIETTTSTSTTTTTTTATAEPASDAGGLFGLHIPGEDDEEPTIADSGVACPYAIHPYYCRRACRSFFARKASMHARRMAHPTRAGIGTCDKYNVFAEDDALGGIVEYYDDTNQLVGVTDSRQKPCGSYGKVPKCKLDIKWEARTGDIGELLRK